MSLTELKIIEPIKNYSKEFENPDEFNIFYTKNKDEVDKLTTHKLNKLYHIKGYRITRIKNILMLKKDYGPAEQPEPNKPSESKLKNDVETLKEKVNQIIEFLNSSNAYSGSAYSASGMNPQTHTVVQRKALQV